MGYDCVAWGHRPEISFAYRLRSLVAAKTVSNIFGIPLIVNWNESWGCPGSFEDSLAPINTGSYKPLVLKFKGNPLPAHASAQKLHSRMVAMKVLDAATHDWPTFLGLYSQVCINQLDAHQDIADAVDAAITGWTNMDEVTGVHIVGLQFSTDMIARMNTVLATKPNQRFFVSANREDARDALITEFGDKILHHNWSFDVQGTPPKDKYMTCPEITQDLFTLKRCADILSSKHAPLGWLASRMGVIDVIGSAEAS